MRSKHRSIDGAKSSHEIVNASVTYAWRPKIIRNSNFLYKISQQLRCSPDLLLLNFCVILTQTTAVGKMSAEYMVLKVSWDLIYILPQELQ